MWSGSRDVEGSYRLSNPFLDGKMRILDKNDDDEIKKLSKT